jgi:tetratricopeptide (TPR) repeat protein
MDSGKWQKSVSTFAGSRTYRLAIPDLLKPPTPQEWYRRGHNADPRAFERKAADMNRYFQQHPPASEAEMSRVIRKVFNFRDTTRLVTEPTTPIERAQDLCYQAFDIFGRRRVHLARAALEISPECVDAYTILAEQTGSMDQRIALYEQGLAIAARTLGEDTLAERLGEFWIDLKTRPYMRARLGLGIALAEEDRLAEAIPHFQALLQLDPDDHLNTRSLLLPALLEAQRDLEAARLLKSIDEESATWAYGQALLAFRLSEHSDAARRELRRAFETNSYVAEILARHNQLGASGKHVTGSLQEAVDCCDRLRYAFAKTEGALEWLTDEAEQWFAQVAQIR